MTEFEYEIGGVPYMIGVEEYDRNQGVAYIDYVCDPHTGEDYTDRFFDEEWFWGHQDAIIEECEEDELDSLIDAAL
jgi:hypothetical protein